MLTTLWNRAKQWAHTPAAKAAALVGGLSLAGQSHAALDPSITAAFTALQTSFAELLAAAYPVMIAITVGLVIFGMVKMFIHKAAGK